MSKYELTYILRPVEEATLTAANERILRAVQTAGGEIAGRNDWGRRRLAYPIKKLRDGYYTTLHIELPGSAVRGLERTLQLTDDVLRYLVVRVETHTLPPAPPPAPPAPAGTAAGAAAPAATETPATASAEAAAATEAAPVAEMNTPSATAAEAAPMGAPTAEPAATDQPAPAPEGS